MSADARPHIASLIRLEAGHNQHVGGNVNSSLTTPIAATDWVKLETVSYRFNHDEPGNYKRRWDVASRATHNSHADGVVILAKLSLADDQPRVLLVKQFRPPINAVTVELPAGLVDKGETYQQAALRELREETGFRGRVTHVHKDATLSPGFSAESVALVEMQVEGTAEAQDLDENENIQVVSVPLHRMEEALDHMIKTEGVVVMHAVSTFALGLRLAAVPIHP